MTYAMAVLEVNASMGLIVAAPTAGSAGVVPGMMLALQECYRISDQRIVDACSTPVPWLSCHAQRHRGRCRGRR